MGAVAVALLVGATACQPAAERFAGLSGLLAPNVLTPEALVVGGHYDSVPGSPGADDDASGVAGMLELARVLRDVPLRSDHAPFWATGYPAMLATDTANFRNPNYHQPTDTLATLDKPFLFGSTRVVTAGVAAFTSLDADDDGTPDACTAPAP
jgi:Zn-dependent M28 family amino/carboxypeptidase